jgi:hypothetical protein
MLRKFTLPSKNHLKPRIFRQNPKFEDLEKSTKG